MIKSSEALDGLAITVTISDFRRLRIRLGLAKVLFKLGARLLGAQIKLVKDERRTN